MVMSYLLIYWSRNGKYSGNRNGKFRKLHWSAASHGKGRLLHETHRPTWLPLAVALTLEHYKFLLNIFQTK